MESMSAVINVVLGLGALAAAVWAGVTARRLYDIERNRDEAARERQTREHASRVNAWVASCSPDAAQGYGIVVANTADTPVYDVAVSSRFKAGDVDDLRLKFVPPGVYFAQKNGPADQYPWGFARSVEELGAPARPIMSSDKIRVTSLTFADSTGARWRRDEKGNLRADDALEGRVGSA